MKVVGNGDILSFVHGVRDRILALFVGGNDNIGGDASNGPRLGGESEGFEIG